MVSGQGGEKGEGLGSVRTELQKSRTSYPCPTGLDVGRVAVEIEGRFGS